MNANQELNMCVKSAQQRAEEEYVYCNTLKCSLGLALVAWTRQGICQVSLDNHSAKLLTELKMRFPQASIQHVEYHEYLEHTLLTIEEGAALDLPLDMRGTAFQKRVWQMLRDIPIGEVCSYGEIATRLGKPSAARAVAGACAANNLAVLIPCHRIVRSTGDISGYRWGVERKHALLVREGVLDKDF